MTRKELAKYIDHSLLNAAATQAEVDILCDEVSQGSPLSKEKVYRMRDEFIAAFQSFSDVRRAENVPNDVLCREMEQTGLVFHSH